MLTAFKLNNFKSFQDEAVLPLGGALTVLIGANAAGKSNVLEALRLLSWLASGNKLAAIQREVNTRADSFRCFGHSGFISPLTPCLPTLSTTSPF